jgi:hypothetical protein
MPHSAAAYYPVSVQDREITSHHNHHGFKEYNHHQYEYDHQDDTQHDEDHQEEPHALYCMSCHAFLSMIFFLACITFTILVIYALVTNNTESVRIACTDLYPYMVTRTALSFCVFFAVCTYGIMYGPTERPERNTVLVFFFLIYFMVLAIWGAVVVSKSMIGNQTCINALHDKTFNAALLGNLGWVYIVVDVFYALCTVLIILRTQLPSSNNNETMTMGEDTEHDQA